MGGGAWTTASYSNYMRSTKCINNVDVINTTTVNQFYDARKLDPALDPKDVKIRECRDSEEHPNTIPVILALDVTGSMGSACAAVARKLDEIITGLYKDVKDVEFMVMGIGDFAYDNAPLQVSQFESDVRICDQLGKIYFERGGGGNHYESYTAAWYFALNHTDLDCWKRGKKGIIITLGDEPLNPYLPGRAFNNIFGYSSQDINTKDLYAKVSEKYDIYHIIITDRETSSWRYLNDAKRTFGEIIGSQNVFANLSEELPKVIHQIVTDHVEYSSTPANTTQTTDEGITW